METTREKILILMRKKGSTTASELTEPLKMTLSAVRQHLQILEQDDQIEAKSVASGPGRPALHYTLTEKAESFFKKTYDSLSLELLEYLEKKDLEGFFRKRKLKLIEKHKGAPDLKSISRAQSKAGYMAKVTSQKGLPVLEEYNCPFIEVAKKFPEFCEAERAAYEKVLGKPVKLQGCRALGANVCRFCVGK